MQCKAQQCQAAFHTSLVCGEDCPNQLSFNAHLCLCRCIVAAGTGRGVFDGNVRVEQKAQKTDAGQLSRNLLLVPRATVNVKPNLQIVADDVKCTHGCAVSDLEEDQLFYFRQAHATLHAVSSSVIEICCSISFGPADVGYAHL